jgi:voltage-gated potassium channel
VIPTIRVVISVRLVRSMFRRGNLVRFLAAAIVLVVNGAAAVYFYERHAPGSNIHTFGQAIWWSLVTVTTVGYGDFYAVTTLGRIAAVCIMAIGLITLAVITAQVASSFVEQAARRRAAPSTTDSGDTTLADLAERLDRIEALPSSPGPAQ